MADNIGSMAVQITGSTTGLTSALKQSENHIGAFHKKVEKDGKEVSLLERLGIGAVAGGAAGLTMKGLDWIKDLVTGPAEMLKSMVFDSIKLAAEFEDIQADFKTILGSAQEGTALFKEIEEASDGMRISLRAGAESAKILLGVDIDAGQIVPTMKMLGDLAMGDAEKLKTLAQAYARIRDEGVVSEKTLRTLSKQGINLGNEIARAMGVDRTELKGLMEDGKVGFRDLQQAMIASTSEGGKFFGAIEERGKTLSGLIDNLKNNWEDFQRGFGQILIEEFGLKDVLSGLSDVVNFGKDNIEGIRPFVHEIAETLKSAAKVGIEFAFTFAIALADAADSMGSIASDMKGVRNTIGSIFPTLSLLSKGKHEQGGAAEKLAELRALVQGLMGTSLPNAPMKNNNLDEGNVLGTWARIAFGQAGGAAGKVMQEMIVRGLGFKLAPEFQEAVNKVTIDPFKLSGAQAKQGADIQARQQPLNEMNRQLADLWDARKLGAFKGNNIDKMNAFNFGAAEIFNKFASGVGQVQLAGAAMKDSADAISAINQDRVGNTDPQARVVSVLEAIRIQTEQANKYNAELVKALNAKGMFLEKKGIE